VKVYLFKFLLKGTAILNINYFDFLLATWVFEILHNNQFESAIKEIARVIKKGIYIEDLFETFPVVFQEII